MCTTPTPRRWLSVGTYGPLIPVGVETAVGLPLHGYTRSPGGGSGISYTDMRSDRVGNCTCY